MKSPYFVMGLLYGRATQAGKAHEEACEVYNYMQNEIRKNTYINMGVMFLSSLVGVLLGVVIMLYKLGVL